MKPLVGESAVEKRLPYFNAHGKPQCGYCGSTQMHRCEGTIAEAAARPRARVVRAGHHRVEMCVSADRRCRLGGPGACRRCPYRASS